MIPPFLTNLGFIYETSIDVYMFVSFDFNAGVLR